MKAISWMGIAGVLLVPSLGQAQHACPRATYGAENRLIVGCGGDWTQLTLRNGWQPADDSNIPAVGLVDGIVTFRGALDGTHATNNVPFCLTDGHTSVGPDYTRYRPSDVGYLGLRAALASGATASLLLGSADPDPIVPEQELDSSFCMLVQQHGQSPAPGPDAREFTSLEGVTYTKSAFGVPQNALQLELADWHVIDANRGSDAALPDGPGIYVKVVNGFVRFQGTLQSNFGTPGAPINPLLFTLPAGQGLIPDNPVYLPVSVSPLNGQQAGRIVIEPNGDVIVEGPLESAREGVALDGTGYSTSSPASALPIRLSDGWSASTSRAVRARLANGIVRLEGAVKNGTSSTLGTLPAGMRPAKPIYLVAEAQQFAQPATLLIDTDGSIDVVSPALVVAEAGISLDGVSFAQDGPFECTGACLNATPLIRYQNSGAFGTTGERWFVVSQNINGWQASEMAGRSIRVNGVVVTPGQMPLPAAVDGSLYYFQFSAGDLTWASWSFW